MIGYETIKNKPYIFQSFTSLTVQEFQGFLPAFQKVWDQYIYKTHIEGKIRERAYGGGTQFTLESYEDKLLFILFYSKIYPIQEVQGFFFGMSQETANETIHILMPLVEEALGYEMRLPSRQPLKLEEVLRTIPSLEFFLDATERKIQRPKDETKQKENYSGKKKAHTRKNILVTTRKQEIVYMGPTVAGKIHDKKEADTEHLQFPRDSLLYEDLGFLGYHPDGVMVILPKKKAKGKELTMMDKLNNTYKAKVRVTVEHAICGVKRLHIVKDTFRNHRKKFDDLVMNVACGLHNVRVATRTSYSS